MHNRIFPIEMNRFLSILALLLLVGVAAEPAFAQNEQQSESSMLPEIDPQDIEIRSQFQARFPGLRRQPILGFEPASRIYQVDPNRMPFMETQEQVVANLPVSELSRPNPPQYYSLYNPQEINLFGRIGFGSYGSPEADIWGVKRLSDKRYIGGDLSYFSSDGHLENGQSAFSLFNLNGEFASKLGEKTRIDITAGIQNNYNQMFNIDNVSDDSRKDVDGSHIGIQLTRFKNTIMGWNAKANIRFYKAALDADNLSGTADEMVYRAAITKNWAGANVNETFAIMGGIRGGDFTNSEFSDQWITASAGLRYERLFNYSTNITVDGKIYYGKDRYSSKFYLGPSVKVEHPLLDFVTLKVKAEAAPFFKTAEQLHTGNRFLNTRNDLRHSYRINSIAEVELSYSKVGTLTMGIQYENITDYPVFIRDTFSTPIGVPQPLFYTTDYTDIYTLKAYAGATHELIAHRFWLNARVYIQSPQIQGGGQIPFEEELGVQSGFSLRPLEKLTIEAWANYIGPRETSLNDDLNGALLIGGQVDVRITDHFGAYLKLKNLLNQDYQVWQGFTERPFQVYGGLTFKL